MDPGATIANAWTRVVSKRNQEPPLPTPFELPQNFQPKVQVGLDAQNLTGTARGKFVTSIAEAIYRYKSYPTKDEYDHVALQTVKKWKFLNCGTGHVSYMSVCMHASMIYTYKVLYLNACYCFSVGLSSTCAKRAHGLSAQARWAETGECKWIQSGHKDHPSTDASIGTVCGSIATRGRQSLSLQACQGSAAGVQKHSPQQTG